MEGITETAAVLREQLPAAPAPRNTRPCRI